jgi:hypothetical protein
MPATIASKVYDFKMPAVKAKLVSAFRQRRNESTIADLVAATGLPTYQVEQTSRVVLDEYGGHCKVTESGEILYYFPRGMKSRITGFVPRAKQVCQAIAAALGKFFKLLFKIWIMAMLVGYFVLFLVIIVAAIVLAVAASASSRSSRRSRGGFSAFYLVMRLIEFFLRIFFWVNISKSIDPSKPVKKGRAFYKSIFGFVFGDADPNPDWDIHEKISVISFIRSQKGVITPDELSALTGRDPEGAQGLINAYLVEFEGEPAVTEDGSLYYFFPELLRTRKEELLTADVTSVSETACKKLIPFSDNKGGTNGLIVFFNAFNLLFGGYFALLAGNYLAAGSAGGSGFEGLFLMLHNTLLVDIMGIPAPALGIFIALGLVPLVFSFAFFLLPFIRRLRLRSRNEAIRRENLRKKIYGAVYHNPLGVDPLALKPSSDAETPANAVGFIQHTVDRLAADKDAEIEKLEGGKTVYHFAELKRELEDIARLRKSIDPAKYDVGKTVFDTNQ